MHVKSVTFVGLFFAFEFGRNIPRDVQEYSSNDPILTPADQSLCDSESGQLSQNLMETTSGNSLRRHSSPRGQPGLHSTDHTVRKNRS